MSQPYVGEIRLFAGTFAPAGWEFCQGAVLPISQYETLFNLIVTTYGGGGELHHLGRRRSAPRQHAAVPRPVVHHLPLRDLPPHLTHAFGRRPIRRGDPRVRVQLRPGGVGDVRRPAAVALAEHRAVLAAG